MLLVGSPMCSAFSQLQTFNWRKMGSEKVSRLIRDGSRHLRFCAKLYRMQMEQGLYFLHEHPAHARSWKDPTICKLMEDYRVNTVVGSMCMFGMIQGDPMLKEENQEWVRKDTRFMTNAIMIAERLNVICDRGHKHTQLAGGKAKRAEVYPEELYAQMVKSLLDQMRYDGRLRDTAIGCVFAVEEGGSECVFWDDVSGEPLNTEGVIRARLEKIAEFRKIRVYEKVPISQCWERTGKGPIGVRWVDINKGDLTSPEYRSRLVAKEIKRDKRDDLFAATPPLEAKKALFSFAVTEGIGWKGSRESGMKIDFIDVKRVYFFAKAKREVYVDLIGEDATAGMCGRLLQSMYGTRDAAQNWEEEYSGFMVGVGFRKGKASPCVFYHKDRNVRVVVHGDDFTVLGHVKQLDWFREEIAKKYEVKFRGRLGPNAEDCKSIRILNRVVTWGSSGIVYEADQRHAEIIIAGLGIKGKRSVVTPGVKSENQKEEEHDDLRLDPSKATEYRGMVARGNYLSADRLDIKYAVKELSRWMSAPRRQDWRKLVRLGKYLIGRERYRIRFDYQGSVKWLENWTDTDYAGCMETRKSTSGGLIRFGKHLLRGWSSTQKVIALSSGEAEFYGMVRGGAESLGTQCLLKEMEVDVTIRILEDSSAAEGIAERTG